MTVEELLEIYGDKNSTISIKDTYGNLIFRDALGLVVANGEFLQREVVKFNFDCCDELSIHIKETVYEAVQQMSKEEFNKFCYTIYNRGWNDYADDLDDEVFFRKHIADFDMKKWEELNK